MIISISLKHVIKITFTSEKLESGDMIDRGCGVSCISTFKNVNAASQALVEVEHVWILPFIKQI